MKVLSPLTQSETVTLERLISKNDLIQAYKSYGIDVTPYFNRTDAVRIYKCNESGYRFYYPLDLGGDSKFYEHFQNFDWYYMPWKWEHEITLSYLKPGFKVLEVGCAHGAFIKRITELQDLDYCIGLELNESTTHKTDKYEIRNETIQSYALNNKEVFDVVCSYQVLEHIAEVDSFISAKIDCLKKDGILIISVPNNDSFIRSSDSCLNMPPHHMGLWSESSLRQLENRYPIKLKSVHLEELQEYHASNYLHAEYYSKYPALLRKIIRKMHKISGIYGKRFKSAMERSHEIIGHTILITFEKK